MKFLDLKELWIISSKRRGSEQIIPVHEIAEHLDDDIIEVLPGLHALTGIMTISFQTDFWYE